jgi:hypothetical protein
MRGTEKIFKKKKLTTAMRKIKKFLQLRRLIVACRTHSLAAGSTGFFDISYNYAMRYERLMRIARAQPYSFIWKFV